MTFAPAPWDPPATPAADLTEAVRRFLDAAQALKEHDEKLRREGNPSARTRFGNAATWMALDNGYQMITGEPLPLEFKITQN